MEDGKRDGLATLLSSLHAGGSDFRLYEDLSIGVMVGGGDALAVCRALRGLPVGFLSFALSKLRVRLVP